VVNRTADDQVWVRVMSRQRPEGVGVRGFDGASVRQVGASSGSWGVVIARQGPQPVGRLLASPSRFLMGTGGRLDRADQLAISRQRPVAWRSVRKILASMTASPRIYPPLARGTRGSEPRPGD
jgi:hypothetical protein